MGRKITTGSRTGAQRQRRYVERKKDAQVTELKAVTGSPKPASITHGTSPVMMRDDTEYGKLAAAIISAFLASEHTPAYCRDPSYFPAAEQYGWRYARVILLRRYCSGLDLEQQMTEFSEMDETQRNPQPGVQKRVTLVRSRQSALKQLMEAESALEKSMTALGLTPMARARLGKDFAKAAKADLALIWAEDDQRDSG